MNGAFYIDNLDGLREKLARASRDGTRLGRVWDSVVRRARNAPGDFPWFTPLVALVGGEPQGAEPLLALLRAETREPLFSQPPLEGGGNAGATLVYPVAFPADTTEATKEAWRRRGRLLQAGCLALANLGAPTAPLLELLHDFATDQKRDYMVRAAACKALGQLACPESLPVLEQATQDEEWCTACEARKAVAAIRSRPTREHRHRPTEAP
jgi:HEAT repeat protein